MAIKVSQTMKQTQGLKMTPQLQQAIKLLTLTHLEMTNVIAEEMVENPMLEELDGSNSSDGETAATEERLTMQNEEATSDRFQEEGPVNKDEFDWQSYIETYNSTSSSPPNMATQDFDELPNYENIVSKGQTLVDHLEWQLRMEELDEESLNFGMSIIHNINDDGYLSLPFEEILKDFKIDKDTERKCGSSLRDLIL